MSQEWRRLIRIRKPSDLIKPLWMSQEEYYDYCTRDRLERSVIKSVKRLEKFRKEIGLK